MKTITISDENWQNLTKLKADIMARDLDAALSYLIIKGDGKGVKNED